MFELPSALEYLSLSIFSVLSALALKLTFGNLTDAGLHHQIQQNCPADFVSSQVTPHRLTYTGLSSVDEALCGIVYFFHLALTPEILPFLTYFMSTAMPLLVLPALESHRPGRHFLLALPLVFGLLMQVMTVGAVMPIYWLIFILSGAAQRRADGEKSTISTAHVQAVAFGLFIGAAVPSACLLLLEDSYVTAIWQLFPLWQYLAQSAHLLVRPPSTHKGSAFPWVQALYIGAFIYGSSVHVATLANAKTLEGVKVLFLPSVTPSKAAAPNMKVMNFLQWDAFFAFTSSLLGTVWFAADVSQAICIILWNVVGSALVGPGASIAAVALWRESYLNQSGITREVKQKSE